MTGTDLCVNKYKQSRSYLNHLVYSLLTPAVSRVDPLFEFTAVYSFIDIVLTLIFIWLPAASLM